MAVIRIADAPYPADWYAISLRWVAVLGLLVAVARGGILETASVWPLVLIVIWNAAMSIMAGENARLAYHRQINLTVDVLLSAAFFWLQGGLQGPASWAGLLPILTAAVYYEIPGAFSVAGLFGLLGLVRGWSYVGSRPSLAFSWVIGLLGIGGVFGVLGAQLMSRVRSKREAWLSIQDAHRRLQRDRLQAIYDVSSTLIANLSYRRVLDAALDMGYFALNPDAGETAADPLVSAALLFRGGSLQVGASRRFTGADARLVFDAGDGLLKKVFDEGEPMQAHDVANDPELGRVIALRGCSAGYLFPLRSGFNVYGLLLFAHPDPNFFTPVRRDLLDIIGRQAAIAVQNAHLYQDLLEEKERMVEVHEEARRKLARDLHDGPTQSVAAMAMRISIARRMLEDDPGEAVQELAKIEDIAQHAGKELRHMLFTLRPLVLESQGLNAALKSMADKIHDTFDQDVTIEVDEELIGDLGTGKQSILFYMIEEAVTNARKHANAAHIWVRLGAFKQGVALLEIEDDGIGFDVNMVDKAYDRRSSLGLINLRERAELIAAVFDIRSSPGKGTKVSIYVPLTAEAADRLQHEKIS